VVMEVSSHALEQGRVYGLHYDVALFTNLTRDHLDYHRTMEGYAASKQKLFEANGSAPPRVAVINGDDGFGRSLYEIAKRSGSELISYGLNPACDVTAEDIKYSSTRTRFSLRLEGKCAACESRLIGEINVYNLLTHEQVALTRDAAALLDKQLGGKVEAQAAQADEAQEASVDDAPVDESTPAPVDDSPQVEEESQEAQEE